ncbi:hypothetical protein [Nocardioides sp. AE5]|uniref:hypothetical protein n=1 Tax=Nocardioides sp. AE5 TaxID=2962573 RepID=UPI002880F419|nr:hypothetical protein [Nocardioides sp. AE5]MDT0203514.1 hypothetical protein [Nocardioides sp. AE5]
MPQQEENPVVNGFVALIAVAVVVGLLGGISVLVATNVLGVGQSNSAAGPGASGGESLVMPDPTPTATDSGPLITLNTPDESSASGEESSAKPSPTATETKEEKPTINLSQGAFRVEKGGQLYLSGTYPGGEGAVLDIEQRVNDGSWQEFPVDVNVSGGTFSVYVQTRSTGNIEWRVVDKDNGVKSNAVRVQHG